MHNGSFFSFELYNLHLLLLGVITLLAAMVPNMLRNKNITAPIIYLFLGGILIPLASNYYYTIAVLNNINIIKKISEFVVLIALVNAGLKIKKPFSWQTWKHSFWLLAVTMPLTIIAASFIGWWVVGLAPATAVLFGALIAPTDPVLASDLQTTRPSKEDISRTRLALTSEAGLNDGLAFPFTYFAIFMVSKGGDVRSWLGEWLLIDVLYKIIVGAAAGLFIGFLLYKLIFSLTSKKQHARISRGILSLSLTLLPYAITEIIGGYGFIAVFIAACTFSNSERTVLHMDNLHDFTEELERIFVAILFVAIGIYAASQIKALLDLRLIVAALLLVVLVRPVAGYLALFKSGLQPFEKFAISFYGIRGIGSIFYLTYALHAAEFPGSEKLIQLTAVSIILSVFIHGVSAATIQKKLDKYNEP